jgi:hypothetical protein
MFSITDTILSWQKRFPLEKVKRGNNCPHRVRIQNNGDIEISFTATVCRCIIRMKNECTAAKTEDATCMIKQPVNSLALTGKPYKFE